MIDSSLSCPSSFAGDAMTLHRVPSVPITVGHSHSTPHHSTFGGIFIYLFETVSECMQTVYMLRLRWMDPHEPCTATVNYYILFVGARFKLLQAS